MKRVARRGGSASLVQRCTTASSTSCISTYIRYPKPENEVLGIQGMRKKSLAATTTCERTTRKIDKRCFSSSNRLRSAFPSSSGEANQTFTVDEAALKESDSLTAELMATIKRLKEDQDASPQLIEILAPFSV